MIAKVYYRKTNELMNNELVAVRSFLKSKGISIEEIPLTESVQNVQIILNSKTYNSSMELYEAENKGDLPKLLKG